MAAKQIVEEVETPSTITINGIEYSPEDAQSLIELGTKTRDLEKQWDTPVDKVWPEYGKTRETLKTTEAERDQAKKELADFQAKQNAGVETQTDITEAKEAARKLGITLNEDLEKSGYIRKEELPQLFATYAEEQREVTRVLNIADNLEKEIDGKDGRPRFNKKAVLAYADAYQIPDLMNAYEDMHKEAVDTWKQEQINSKKSEGLKTLNSGGSKQVKETKVTDDNVNDLLKETLYGAE